MRFAKRVFKFLASGLRSLRGLPFSAKLVDGLAMAWYDLPVPPTHYYSPLPEMPSVKRRRDRWFRQYDMSQIPMDLACQCALLGELARFRDELRQLPSFAALMAQGHGPGYGEIEAQLLHGMVRRLKPRRVVEVGSGVSTRFLLHALERNKAEDGRTFQLDCFEPYPTGKLRQLHEKGLVSLHVQQVQDAGGQLAGMLGAGDLLFIDSSHAGKIDSDVYYLYLEVLPALRPGVVVHIHDITFPYLSLPATHPLADLSLLWNESALAMAMLTANPSWEVLMCQSLLHFRHPEALRQATDAYDPGRHLPTSLWLRKK